MNLETRLDAILLYSNGKLLLTSEYLVMDGAAALAIPNTGQSLTDRNFQSGIQVESLLSVWFAYDFPSIGQLKSGASRVILFKNS
jgi:hypothetical protein